MASSVRSRPLVLRSFQVREGATTRWKVEKTAVERERAERVQPSSSASREIESTELTGSCLGRRKSENFSFLEVSGVAFFENEEEKRERERERVSFPQLNFNASNETAGRLTKFDDGSDPRESQPPQRTRRILRRRSQSTRSPLLLDLVDETLRNIASVEGERNGDYDELESKSDGL